MLPDSLPLLRRRDDKQYVFASKTEQSFTEKYPSYSFRNLLCRPVRKKKKRQPAVKYFEVNATLGRDNRNKKKVVGGNEAFYIIFADTESSRDVQEPLLKFCKVWLCKTMWTRSVGLLSVFILFTLFSLTDLQNIKMQHSQHFIHIVGGCPNYKEPQWDI